MIMNILKNMEIIFVATLAIAASAAYVSSAPDAQAAPEARAAVNTVAPGIPVVVVHAKRLTALEKQRSLAEERLASSSARVSAL
jgi:hypothetical protein